MTGCLVPLSPAPLVTSVAVVVPAHDEADLIGACLSSLRMAADRVSVPVRVLVVLDDCTDATAQECLAAGVEFLTVSARNVGSARAAGMAALLHGEIRGRWLATTDADTVVPPEWLRLQLDLAAGGADAVAGVVDVADWGEHPVIVRRAYDELYQAGLGPAAGSHLHVHGANLGVRATAYLAAGGFAPLPVHEDHALVAALEALGGVRVVRSTAVRVTTSARRDFRAALGFGDLLTTL